MDRHCATVPTGEELFFSEGDCFWDAVVCRVQIEQVLGGGVIVSSLLRREGGRKGARDQEERGGGKGLRREDQGSSIRSGKEMGGEDWPESSSQGCLYFRAKFTNQLSHTESQKPYAT